MGGSSGGHLIALTALLAAPGIADDPDPVNREPATLQAIVLRATPTDLIAQARADHGGGVAGFLELPWPADAAGVRQNPRTEKRYREASPSTYVSPKAPPTLLIHGDADESVPFQESVAMEAAARDGWPLIVARAFNHTGPGQRREFVVPALAARPRVAA
jgi:acetyl esterase/lipase